MTPKFGSITNQECGVTVQECLCHFEKWQWDVIINVTVQIKVWS